MQGIYRGRPIRNASAGEYVEFVVNGAEIATAETVRKDVIAFGAAYTLLTDYGDEIRIDPARIMITKRELS